MKQSTLQICSNHAVIKLYNDCKTVIYRIEKMNFSRTGEFKDLVSRNI